MNQTKLSSLIEVCVSLVIGCLVTLAASPFIYPMFGHSFTFSQNFGLMAVFTVLSLIRGYVIRRWFNARIKKFAQKASGG